MPEHRQIKATAMKSLKGKWLTAIILTLFSLVLGVYVFAPTPSIAVSLEDIQANPALLVDLKTLFRFDRAFIRSVIFFLLGAPAMVSLCGAYQMLCEGKEFTWKSAFCRWYLMYKAIGLRVLRTLIVAVGLLLVIVPGIVAHYTFGMSSWILADNPDMSISGALRMSRSMMRGHKMELLTLDLSFAPWALVTLLTVGGGLFFYSPYHRAARAAYYMELKKIPILR